MKQLLSLNCRYILTLVKERNMFYNLTVSQMKLKTIEKEVPSYQLNNLCVLQGEGGGGHGRGLVTQLLVLGLRHLRRCGERRGLAEAVARELDEEVRVVQSHAAVRLTEE